MRRCTVGGMRKPLAVTAAAVVAPLLLTVGACSWDESAVRTVDADRAVELIGAEQRLVVIDVRTPAEFAAGHVAGALNVDVTSRSFPDDLAELDKDVAYLVYCQTGNRSETAVAKMRELGFSDLVDAGGVASLQDAGAEIVAGP
jgi:phage shock protein E